MTKHVEYEVAREHLGDRQTDDGVEQHLFAVGETRTANPVVVKHLVDNGILIAPSAAKSEPSAPENKAEGPAAKNKGK